MPNNSRRQGLYWLLTIPEEDGSFCDGYSLPDSVRYLKGQLEQGAGGYRHWQVLACFVRKTSLRGVKEIFGQRSHAELTRSSAANEYVWKEETRIGDLVLIKEINLNMVNLPSEETTQRIGTEYGNLPKPGILSPSLPTFEYSIIGRYELLVQTLHNLQQWNGLSLSSVVELGPGSLEEPGAKLAWMLTLRIPELSFGMATGIKSTLLLVVLINVDEFRGSIDIAHLLRWFDRYPCLVEIKGSATSLVAEKIWITSNLHPKNWFPDLDYETYQALARRLEIVEFE